MHTVCEKVCDLVIFIIQSSKIYLNVLIPIFFTSIHTIFRFVEQKSDLNVTIVFIKVQNLQRKIEFGSHVSFAGICRASWVAVE